MPALPRRRRLLLATLAASFGLAVAVGLVEFGLRIVDPLGLRYEVEFTRYRTQALQFAWEQRPAAELDLDGRLYWHKPNLDLDLGSFRLRTNRLGCRGPEVAVPKPADVFRIVLLGDSVAFGWGVDDEVTFARRLEREHQPRAGARRLEVVNTALPMYDTNQEEATLRELGLSLQPDLVLLVYVVNDIEPTRDVVEQTLRATDPHPEEDLSVPDDFWSWAGTRLGTLLPACGKLVALRSDLEARMQRRLPPGATYRPERFGKGPRGWPRSQAALLRIAAQCRAANVPLLLFDHTLPRLEPLPPFCREHGIDCVPLWFSPEDHRLGIVNSPLDTHANARGHGLLLERLVAALRDRKLLPE
ncbi:MAG: SGNH/GDSL hydrolase family protein [Planctomycetes bacterium]|nr:SGNH/GDSL hydrolase family protein [Planctomycetota bacterium]